MLRLETEIMMEVTNKLGPRLIRNDPRNVFGGTRMTHLCMWFEEWLPSQLKNKIEHGHAGLAPFSCSSSIVSSMIRNTRLFHFNSGCGGVGFAGWWSANKNGIR